MSPDCVQHFENVRLPSSASRTNFVSAKTNMVAGRIFVLLELPEPSTYSLRRNAHAARIRIAVRAVPGPCARLPATTPQNQILFPDLRPSPRPSSSRACTTKFF